MRNESPNHIIETDNLQLILCEPEHYEAILRDKRELEPLLNLKVLDDWPLFPESIPYSYKYFKEHPSSVGWGMYLFAHTKDRALIGNGGFKGAPDEEGLVEIGYAIVSEYRRRGLATEAARGLARYAFSYPEVKIIQAHTLKDGIESMGVLRKLGMKLVGTAQDPDEGEVLRWRVERKDFIL
ncbi:MAG: GNAT family N-acetyltransferase [Acidobacteriota bacterium]|nr:GNAT family N-acetyltransferase [Acidobacteriota bacterium]